MDGPDDSFRGRGSVARRLLARGRSYASVSELRIPERRRPLLPALRPSASDSVGHQRPDGPAHRHHFAGPGPHLDPDDESARGLTPATRLIPAASTLLLSCPRL